MLHIFIVERPKWLLICAIPPKEGVTPIDLQKLQIRKAGDSGQYKTIAEAVSGQKGLIIADSTQTIWVSGFIFSEARNKVPWVAGYQRGQAIVFNTVSPERVAGESFAAPLYCAKCLEDGIEKKLRADAIYPFCRKHQDSSPHRF